MVMVRDWVAETAAEVAELEAERIAARRSELAAAAGAWADRSALRRRLELEADRWAAFEGTAGEYVAERYGCGGAA